jgi:nitrous oxide reductase accessory protein NosL
LTRPLDSFTDLALGETICFVDIITGIVRLGIESMQLQKDTSQGEIVKGVFIKRVVLFFGIFGFSILHFSVLADGSKAGPQPGLTPLDERGAMQISSQDRCPVCAMQVSKYKKFACAVQLMNGNTFYFCGSGCMIRSWMHPDIFLGAEKEELKRSVVQDYFTGEQVSGRSVYWVAGSDVIGPMGPALVPLKNEQDLDVFKKRHGAKAVIRLSEMTDEKWQQLTGKKAAAKK